jgi:hypothetical protein
MEIKFMFRGSCYSVCIGRKTKWFESIYLITIIQEWYNKGYGVEYAEILHTLFERR